MSPDSEVSSSQINRPQGFGNLTGEEGEEELWGSPRLRLIRPHAVIYHALSAVRRKRKTSRALYFGTVPTPKPYLSFISRGDEYTPVKPLPAAGGRRDLASLDP